MAYLLQLATLSHAVVGRALNAVGSAGFSLGLHLDQPGRGSRGVRLLPGIAGWLAAAAGFGGNARWESWAQVQVRMRRRDEVFAVGDAGWSVRCARQFGRFPRQLPTSDVWRKQVRLGRQVENGDGCWRRTSKRNRATYYRNRRNSV